MFFKKRNKSADVQPEASTEATVTEANTTEPNTIEANTIKEKNEESEPVYTEKIVEVEKEPDILGILSDLAPAIQKLIPMDCMVGITDKEKYLTVIPGETIKISQDLAGKHITESDAINIAMKEDKPVQSISPKEVYGVEFNSSAVPVKNKSGEIIGGLGIAISLENRDKLIGLSESVAAMTQQTSSTIEELAASAERMASQQNQLRDLGKEVADQVNKTQEVLEFINGIAKTSNLLGLNASIEASRAGESGRGFSVVASEIRKMAENSAKSIKDIKNTLLTIKEKTEEMMNKIVDTAGVIEEQSSATEEVSATMQELSTSTENLNNASHKVFG